MKNKYSIIAFAAVAFSLVSCDKFLDVMPDNRTELDTQEKIRSLLVSAYPETDYLLVSEFSSDNVDDFGPENPNTDPFIDEVYAWKDVTTPTTRTLRTSGNPPIRQSRLPIRQ